MYKTAEKISTAMGLTAETFTQRKSRIGLSGHEEQLASAVFPGVEPHMGELVGDFCTHLFQFDRVDDLIDKDGVKQLEDIQKTSIARMFSGRYDFEYALDRLATGIFYQRVGIRQEQIFAAFGCYLPCLSLILKDRMQLASEQIVQVLSAFNKLQLLDMALMLDAYHYRERSCDGLNTAGRRRQPRSRPWCFTIP